jgi:hypothetical protein
LEPQKLTSKVSKDKEVVASLKGNNNLTIHSKKKEQVVWGVVWGEDEESEDAVKKKKQHVRGCCFKTFFLRKKYKIFSFFVCLQSILQL